MSRKYTKYTVVEVTQQGTSHQPSSVRATRGTNEAQRTSHTHRSSSTRTMQSSSQSHRSQPQHRTQSSAIQRSESDFQFIGGWATDYTPSTRSIDSLLGLGGPKRKRSSDDRRK